MAIIPRITEEGKEGRFRLPEGTILLMVVILACTLSFGLGFLTGRETEDHDVIIQSLPLKEGGEPAAALESTPSGAVSAKATAPAAETQAAAPAMAAGGQYVASKSGTKYHLPWCPGAKQMKEENKIWFDSKAAAEAAGYTPAANCKGI